MRVDVRVGVGMNALCAGEAKRVLLRDASPVQPPDALRFLSFRPCSMPAR
jgi:hypothetical protein